MFKFVKILIIVSVLFSFQIVFSDSSVLLEMPTAAPASANSQTNSSQGSTQAQQIGNTSGTKLLGIVGCDGSAQNPCDFSAFMAMINRIIKWFITMAISIAAISFAYAGSLILLKPDSSGERERARQIFVKTIKGVVYLLCSWLIVYLIIKTLSGTGSSFLRFLGN